MAKRLSGELSSLGLPIVSGMARGIDTAAHLGALAVNGNTIAVLGSGLGIIYPPENKKLFYKIIESGAVISEFSMMEEPNAYNFPARNRIISGITLGTLVVEAARKSGSLITARLAGEQGREVFAVPGNINSLKSTGTHNLLKQGAKLVAGAQDVVEEFYQFENAVKQDCPLQQDSLDPGTRGALALPEEEARIYNMLEPYPIHIDALAQKAGMGIGKLAGLLLNLELKGIVSQNPGKYFTIR
jgi:DNA processing protein